MTDPSSTQGPCALCHEPILETGDKTTIQGAAITLTAGTGKLAAKPRSRAWDGRPLRRIDDVDLGHGSNQKNIPTATAYDRGRPWHHHGFAPRSAVPLGEQHSLFMEIHSLAGPAVFRPSHAPATRGCDARSTLGRVELTGAKRSQKRVLLGEPGGQEATPGDRRESPDGRSRGPSRSVRLVSL